MGYVLVGSSDVEGSSPIISSDNGKRWFDARSSSELSEVSFTDVIWDGDRWVAIGSLRVSDPYSGFKLSIATSQDGRIWDLVHLGGDHFDILGTPLFSSLTTATLTYDGSKYVVFTKDFMLLKTTDLNQWEISFIYGPGGTRGLIYSSFWDGHRWTINREGETFAAGEWAYSTDLVNWTWMSVTPGLFQLSVGYDDGLYVSNGTLSNDGVTWTSNASLSGAFFNLGPSKLAHGNGIWVLAAVASPRVSTNKIDWIDLYPDPRFEFLRVRYVVFDPVHGFMVFSDVTDGSTYTGECCIHTTRNGVDFEKQDIVPKGFSLFYQSLRGGGYVRGSGWFIGKIGM